MIYVYTEDKKEGLVLMKNAIDIYLSDYNIVVDTIDGIKNLKESVNNLQLNPEDAVYYVYDDVTENSGVQDHLKNGRKAINRSKYKGQINLIPIFCCEHSVLTAVGIEKFSHPDVLKVIFEIQEYKDLRNVTKMTKKNKVFNAYYNKARTKRENTLKRVTDE